MKFYSAIHLCSSILGIKDNVAEFFIQKLFSEYSPSPHHFQKILNLILEGRIEFKATKILLIWDIHNFNLYIFRYFDATLPKFTLLTLFILFVLSPFFVVTVMK